MIVNKSHPKGQSNNEEVRKIVKWLTMIKAHSGNSKITQIIKYRGDGIEEQMFMMH